MEELQEAADVIHGDLLEAALSFVPLVHLLPASRVSKSWKRAVSSSLAHFSKPKPWLMVHVQTKLCSEPRTTFAFDPRSNVWVQMDRPVARYVSTLRSSGPNFLYMLSSNALAFSTDPLHLTWRHIDSPAICRIDPIVAVCGGRIVVAGSGWDFEDDTLAVEVYNPDSSTWRRCQSMPDILKDSAAATWLSVAANDNSMFVMEKASGVSYAFDPVSGIWRGPYDLRPDPRVFFSAVGFLGNELIVAGLIGGAGVAESLRIWKVDRESMDCVEIGEAPAAMVEKLESGGSLRQIELSSAKNLVYLYNPLEPREVVYCEFAGEECVWRSTKNAVWNDDVRIGGRMVFTCGTVEIGDLHMGMMSEDWKFRTLIHIH